jgi:uncharacterized repeat protein (TIGR01451 family)
MRKRINFLLALGISSIGILGMLLWLQVSVTSAVPETTEPDLIVRNLTILPSNPTAGAPFHMMVEVYNAGTVTASGPFFTDLYLDYTPTGCDDFNSLTFWTTDSLEPGESVLFSHLLIAGLEMGNHQLWATVDSGCDVAEAQEANNDHWLDFVVVGEQNIDLSVTQTDANDPVLVGSPFTYTIVVQNLGTDNAYEVLLTDNLPSSTHFVAATITAGSCDEAGLEVICYFDGPLQGGQSLEATIWVMPPVTGVITNFVNVTQGTAVEPNDNNNFAYQSTTIVSELAAIPTPAPALQRRAAQFLEEKRPFISGWEQAQLQPTAVPLYRPDLDGSAYFEFRVESPLLPPPFAQNTVADNQPSGFLILSTGSHDYPIAHWSSSGESPTQQLEREALAQSNSTHTFYKLDTLIYAAEDAQEKLIETRFNNPLVKTTNFDPAWLDAPLPQGTLFFTPTHTGPDLAGTGQISGGQVITSGSISAPIAVTTWNSWTELKAGYADNYAVPLEWLRRQADSEWQIENLLAQYGAGLRRGDVYSVTLLADNSFDISVSGPGASHLTTELIYRGELLPVYRLTVVSDQPNVALPFTVTIPYSGGGSETLLFAVVPPLNQVFLPIMVNGNQANSPTTQNRILHHPGHEYFAAGGHSAQPLYRQLSPREYPNGWGCYSGCGPTALAMLFAWADNQAASGNPYWAPRWGLYRQNGGYGADATPPLWWNEGHTELNGVKSMMMEIRRYVSTFCVFESGATFQWDMGGNAWRYLNGRTGARFQATWNTIPFTSDDHRDRVIHSIVSRQTPAVIGTGFIVDGHYPMAYGYRNERVIIPRCFFWHCWEDVEYRHQFYVNQGWGGSGNGWIPAGTWFAGQLYP